MAAFVPIGCGNPLSAGVHAYDESRYPDAIEELRRLEPDEPSWNDEQRCRYALYRGLSHLAAGDAREADRWLRRAKAAFDRNPAIYDASQAGRLLAAWRSMGRMPGEAR